MVGNLSDHFLISPWAGLKTLPKEKSKKKLNLLK